MVRSISDLPYKMARNFHSAFLYIHYYRRPHALVWCATVGNMASETSPLLRSGDTEAIVPEETEGTNEATAKSVPTASPWTRVALLGSFLLLAALVVSIPIVYIVIIPSQIQEFASGGRGLEIHSVELHALRAKHVDTTLSATLWLKAAAPKPFSILPNAIFSLILDSPAPEGTTRDADLRQSGILLGSIPIEVSLTAEEGDAAVKFTTRTQFGHLNTRLIAGLVNDVVVLGKGMPPQTVLIKGKPYVKPKAFWTLPGGFRVDIQRNFTVTLGDTLGSKDQYHVAIVDKKITPVVNSSAVQALDHDYSNNAIIIGSFLRMIEGKSFERNSLMSALMSRQYSVFLNVSFDNPHPLKIRHQGFGLSFSIYYDNRRIVDIAIPPSSLYLQPLTRNHNVTVNGLTVKENFVELMDLVSKYSDGEEVQLVMSDFKLIYEKDRKSVPWVQDMIGKWSFPVSVPARSVGDDEL
ncbi:hypothetical protein SeLEV6574_g03962 [Synchytrium endobioticum]|nr:hypothetical protein SeLEV6574_g03962 [Synchytrium endobioticum]